MKQLALIALILAILFGVMEINHSVTVQIDPNAEIAKANSRPILHSSGTPVPTAKTAETLSVNATELDVAQAYLREHKNELGLQAHHDLQGVVYHSPLGAIVSFSVSQLGVPILGMEIKVRLDRNKQVESIVNEYRPLKLVQKAGVSILNPVELARELSSYQVKAEEIDAGTLFLYAHPAKNEPEWVYTVSGVSPGNRGRVQLIIRASDGEILSITQGRTENFSR